LSLVKENDKDTLVYDYQFDKKTGEPLIASPGFEKALSLLQRLAPCRPSARAAHPADALAAGTAVAGLITLADVPALRRAEDATKGIRFGISRVPGSELVYGRGGTAGKVQDGNFVPYVGSGGWLGAVSVGAKSPAAAREFLAHLTSPAVSLEIVYEPAWGGGPTRSAQFELSNRAGWFNYGLPADRTTQLISALEKSINPPIENPAFRLRLSDQLAYLQAEAEVLNKALDDGTPAAAALEELAKRWNAIGDPAKRAREYRYSLGLIE